MAGGQCGSGGGATFTPILLASALSHDPGAADGSKFQVWDYEEAEVEALLDRYFEAHHPKQVAASPDPTA